MATFIGSSFILRTDVVLISYIRMQPCGRSMLSCMLDAQISLHPQHIYTYIYIYFFFFVALRPNAGHGLLILEVSDHTQRTTVGRTPLDE
jgi:hypothetical protein